METIKINKNLFDLTKEQIETSKMIYEGKIIKCLVAPYHTYEQLEKIVPFTKTTYLFPEREVFTKLKSLISTIVANPSNEEFRIITANQNIILDMVDDCVRILTEGEEVVPCPIKTFMANIHDIRYTVLENENHQISEEKKTKSHDRINSIINILNDKKKKTISRKEYDMMLKEINMIGEPIIRDRLKDMLSDKDISEIELDETDPKKMKFTKEEIAWIKRKEWYKENLTVKVSLERSLKNVEENKDNYKELRKLHNQLLDTYDKSKNKKEIVNTKNDLLELDKEEKTRMKINTWLAGQPKTSKIKLLVDKLKK